MPALSQISSSLVSRLQAAGLSVNAASNEIPVVDLFIDEELLGGPDGRLTINFLPAPNLVNKKNAHIETNVSSEETSNIIPISAMSRFFDDLTDVLDDEYRQPHRPSLIEASTEALLA